MKKANAKRSKLGLLIRVITFLMIFGYPVLLLSPELFSIHYPKSFQLDFYSIKLPVSEVSVEVRLYYLIITEFLLLILAAGLFAVAKILDMFANERWFLPDFSKHLSTFGISLIFYTLASWVTAILLTLLAGYEIFKNLEIHKNTDMKFTVSGSDLLIILIGIVLITVAKVLKRASENADELEKIV